jgi:hypothetical protein
MHGFSLDPDSSPQRLLPAWVVSLLVHGGMIAVLFYVIKPWPIGGAGQGGPPGRMVLSRASVDDPSDSQPSDAPPTNTLEAPDLIPAPPNEAAPSNAAAVAAQAVRTSAPSAADVGQARTNQASNGAGQGGGPGGDADVSVFGVQGRGSKFIYLFDRSSSMNGPPLTAAKRQLLVSLASLESVHQFHVIFFNTKMQPLGNISGGRRIPAATERNKQLAANFIGGITADGGTDRLTALKEALSFSPDVIFFLSDADDPMTPTELEDIHKANSRARAAICVIEFGRRPQPMPENFLMRLAHETGGQYGYVNTVRLRE